VSDLLVFPEDEYPVFGAAIVMLPALHPHRAAELLEKRTVAIEAALAAGEQVIASLTKSGLARIHLIEIEYAQALRRAELTWVRDLIQDIRSGALPWAAHGATCHDLAETTR
jgi:hypothetical protein